MSRVRAAAARSISSAAEEDRKFHRIRMPAKDYRGVRLCRFFYVLWGFRKQKRILPGGMRENGLTFSLTQIKMNIDSLLRKDKQMPKVTEEYIAEKKQKITDAAYTLCLQKTVSTVTMQDIINETGFSQGGIYLFYKDIDEIFSDMILSLRKRVNIKEKIDAVLDRKDSLKPAEITDALFDMLAEFMTDELMGIEKIDFELSVLAMNAPQRVDKIMKNIPGTGNMEYLTLRTMEYFTGEMERGNIHPRVNAKELLSFISSAWSGIQMTCIVNNCYTHERNPLTACYQPKIQLKLLAKTVNYLIGEDE